MVFPNVIHLWFDSAAVIKNIRASVTEQTAAGQAVQRRHGTGNGVEFSI
jgi:hypothetical protein